MIVRSKRPRRRILRTDGHAAGHDGSTPIRKGCHRFGVTTKVRQPSEHLIAVARKLVIESNIATTTEALKERCGITANGLAAR